MTFGNDWNPTLGADRAESRAIFNAFAEAGGNFIDTAHLYSYKDTTGEELVGDFVRTDRDHFVVSTKYALSMGADINRDYAGQSVILLGVLKGAAIFLSDLSRQLKIDATFDFIGVSSYGVRPTPADELKLGWDSTGEIKLSKDLDHSIAGKNVILVEDILDTGLTLSYLRGLMLQHKPASLKIATCLDKPERRLVPIEADYVAFKIPNQFVIGYGMDYAERYRGVDDIRIFPAEVAGH